eukprot:3926129-Lingulodinium_polyedra.AAC.1
MVPPCGAGRGVTTTVRRRRRRQFGGLDIRRARAMVGRRVEAKSVAEERGARRCCPRAFWRRP